MHGSVDENTDADTQKQELHLKLSNLVNNLVNKI